MNCSTHYIRGITFYKLSNDVNGNPRYLFHYLDIADSFEEALKKAKKAGGTKYRGKDFGGGIVVTTYNLRDTAAKLVK